MLLELRRETEGQFLVGTVILGFLSISSKCQASSPLEPLNSTPLSQCQRDMRPLVRIGEDLGLSLWSTQGMQTSLHLVR